MATAIVRRRNALILLFLINCANLGLWGEEFPADQQEQDIAGHNKQSSATEREIPPQAIGFVLEGIEQSDFGLSRPFSDYQRSRAALGYQRCHENGEDPQESSLLKLFYKSQKYPSNYEIEAPQAIRVLCWNNGMDKFCACDEQGECFVPHQTPTYVEVQPFCDPEEACHAYLELYLGSLRSEDDSSRFYGHLFDAGPFGHRSLYMKAAAVGCNGCARLRRAIAGDGACGGEFVADKLEKQHLLKGQLMGRKMKEGREGAEAGAGRTEDEPNAMKKKDGVELSVSGRVEDEHDKGRDGVEAVTVTYGEPPVEERGETEAKSEKHQNLGTPVLISDGVGHLHNHNDLAFFLALSLLSSVLFFFL